MTDTGFTGHRWRSIEGVWLTLYRAYDPEAARWISEDPIGTKGGLNMYGYVAARPTTSWDPLGLQASCCAELEARRKRLHEILDSLDQGGPVSGGAPYGSTTCSEAGGEYTVDPKTPRCLRDCVVAHEQSHVQQCRRFGPRNMWNPAYERSAYLVELGCVIRKLSQLTCGC